MDVEDLFGIPLGFLVFLLFLLTRYGVSSLEQTTQAAL